jgi:hypothetical protein
MSRTRHRKSGVVVPHQPRWHQRIAARFVHVSLSLLTATLRCRVRYEGDLQADLGNQPAIFAIWHNRLALAMMMYHRFVRRPNPRRQMAAMVSASRDGALLARILENFLVQPVRGSTSRRGPQALLELTTWAERGFDLAITPDGPRGPRYSVQEGVVAVAQLTGLPVVPVSAWLGWKLQAGSWDRFQIPLPFSACDIMVGRMMRLPREASDAEREQFRRQLELELTNLTRD